MVMLKRLDIGQVYSPSASDKSWEDIGKTACPQRETFTTEIKFYFQEARKFIWAATLKVL